MLGIALLGHTWADVDSHVGTSALGLLAWNGTKAPAPMAATILNPRTAETATATKRDHVIWVRPDESQVFQATQGQTGRSESMWIQSRPSFAKS